MSKVNLKIKLKSEEENLDFSVLGIREKNKITYKENNIMVTLLIEESKITMKRVNPEYKLELIFNKNLSCSISKYYFIGGSKFFELHTKTKKCKIDEKCIKIDYNLEGNNFSYVLEMEEL